MHALDQRTLEKLHAKTSKPLDGIASTILNDNGTTVHDLFTSTYQILYAHVLTFFFPFLSQRHRFVGGKAMQDCPIN